MGQPKDARLTSEVAQQICERTGSAAILERLDRASLGSQFVLGLRAKSCNGGKILDQEQIQAARREDVLNSLSQIARKFRTRVGESLATVAKLTSDAPGRGHNIFSRSSKSLQLLATKVDISSGNNASIPFLQTRRRYRPQLRDGKRDAGTCIQRRGGVCSSRRPARQKPGSCVTAPATTSGSLSQRCITGR